VNQIALLQHRAAELDPAPGHPAIT